MRRLFAVLACLAAAAAGQAAHADGSVPTTHPALFLVGTAVVDITPTRPQYLGGFGQMDKPTKRDHDPLQVRAFAVSNGKTLVEFAIVDTQGWFAGYQEGPYGVRDARLEAASYLSKHGFPTTTAANLIVSSTHSHAAPTLMGIWGPVDVDYLRRVKQATVHALEEAAGDLQPAELWTASADTSAINGTHVSQTDIYDGYDVDRDTPILWARDPSTHKTIGMYVNVPVHADVACGACDNTMSADHIGFERRYLHDALGGTAVVAMGTLGRQESIVQVGRFPYSHDVAHTITADVVRALHHATPITSSALAAAESYVLAPVTNPALGALNYANLVAPYTCTPAACTVDRAITPPYVVAGALGTWVTGFRIGDVVYMSEPGEAFPEVSRAIRESIGGAAAVHLVGMAQDQVGYYFPPEEAEMTAAAYQENESDHFIYNSSLAMADLTVGAAADVATSLGFLGHAVHPTPMQYDPDARSKPGVQFFVVGAPLSGFPAQVDSAVNPAQDGGAPLVRHGTQGVITFDWGDGTSSYGGSPTGEGRDRAATHIYRDPGRYTITATVVDGNGRHRNFSQRVTVRRFRNSA